MKDGEADDLADGRGGCSENFGFFKKNTDVGIWFRFNPKCAIMGCFRLTTAADCDWPCALASM